MTTIRDFVFDLLKNDSVLNGLSFSEDVMYNNNDADTPNIRPFMVFKWGQATPGMDVMRVRSLQVWFHDDPSDYSRIDSALERVRNVFATTFGVNTGASDRWVAQFDWELDSDDLDDDIQRTITRYSQYRVIGSAS